ncbi:MAG: pyridoxal 5'-phosphate synthase glutaminase subunit PdxT [Thermoleophilia bacterium]
MLAGLGARPRLVRRLSELQGLAGLVLPGGESTTMLKLLQAEGFTAPAAAEAGSGPASPPGLSGPLRQFAVEGGALFATCAGAILLARRVTAPAQPSVGLLDAVIQRNGYGRQLESHIAWAACPALGAEELEMIFIRAPVIRDVGPAVQVLARHRGDPVLVRQGRILAATFHPELSVDARVHRYFLEQIVGGASARC